MSASTKVKPKIPAKAKARAAQVNRLQRSSDEMGKFDNASATSVPMAIAALVGLGIEVVFYLFLLFSSSRTALKLFMITFMKEVGCLMCSLIWHAGHLLFYILKEKN